MNIIELLDLLASATADTWLDISDELLEAGYSWEYSSRNRVFRLLDLSAYFA